jgi:hypothetical protein
MGNCKEGSCSTSGEEKCGSGSSDCGQSSGCEMTDMFMKLGNQAWEELMVEKMKKQWEALRGQNMDKMAQAGVEASMAYWQHKMEGKMKCHESKEKIKQSMMG